MTTRRSSKLPLLLLSGQMGSLAIACGGADTAGGGSPIDAIGFATGTPIVCSDYNSLKNAYFGDLHVHTSFSIDAYSFGTRNDPSGAYRFAKGSPLTLAGGQTAQLDRPLHFMAVTDHGEFLSGNAWSRSRQATDAAYSPCSFTSLHGYEYTKSDGGSNQHRNVVFGSSQVPSEVYDARAYPTPEQLWRALENGCTVTAGCDAIAIPHNSNQSNGMRFAVATETLEDASRRSRIEVLAEVFQGKGASECLNTADPGDEGYDPKCDFEILADAEPSDAPGYVRSGLENGLLYQAANGVNPVETGLIASTDTHNATGGNVAESTWPGHHGTNDDTPTKRLTKVLDHNPGGLAVAWAEQNTRESLFAAFKRRETYGTSGPRMIVRFYQTWNTGDACTDPSFPAALAANGVPMGGRMTSTGGSAPRFVVYAAKDQVNLTEIDIIKASVVNGRIAERIVVLRSTNPLAGDAVMCRTWVDDDYDPSAPAFYYARVLQRATWRWSHYDCSADPATCQRDERIQERAWTSPIWSYPAL